MNKYYVYSHMHPITGLIVYIGKGCYGRAWDVTRNRKKSNPAHEIWMQTLVEEGYIPIDWTTIIFRGLSEKEAFEKEKNVIHQYGCPIFNRQSGEKQHQSKLTNEQAINIYELTKDGIPHKEIADYYGVSKACVSMISTITQWKAVLLPYIKAKNEARE